MTDRARQLEFIKGYGNSRILDEAAQLVVIMGDDFFTDAQIKMICERVVDKEKFRNKLMIENRRIMRGE